MRPRLVAALAALALPAALVPAVSAPASAGTRTTVSGWSTTPATVIAGESLRRTLTVRTGSRYVERAVVLQHRPVGATGWTRLDRDLTDGRGLAVLTSAVPGTGDLRAKVLAARTAPGVATAPVAVTVTEAPAEPTDPTFTPSEFETRVLQLTNEVRADGATCGGTRFAPKPALTADPTLGSVARAYAQKMGEDRFFDHTSPDGDDPGDRITAAGYDWRSYGENIAAGYATPRDVVDGWVESTGHCRNIMSAQKHLGVGYASVDGSPYGSYWVQVFATPQ